MKKQMLKEGQGMFAKCWMYPCKVSNVVDGDTVDVVIDQGFSSTSKKRIRLSRDGGFDFDTYETTLRNGTTPAEKEKGIEAKNFLQLLTGGEQALFVRTFKLGTFRYVGQLYLEDGTNVADIMHDHGYTKQ